MKKCIICQAEIVNMNAVRVREDRIIAGIRKIKKMFGIAQNNELYVCEKDYETNSGRRQRYEKDVIIFTLFAAIIIVVLITLPLISGQVNVSLIFTSLLLGGLIIAFAVIFKYVPATEENMEFVTAEAEKPKKGKR